MDQDDEDAVDWGYDDDDDDGMRRPSPAEESSSNATSSAILLSEPDAVGGIPAAGGPSEEDPDMMEILGDGGETHRTAEPEERRSPVVERRQPRDKLPSGPSPQASHSNPTVDLPHRPRQTSEQQTSALPPSLPARPATEARIAPNHRHRSPDDVLVAPISRSSARPSTNDRPPRRDLAEEAGRRARSPSPGDPRFAPLPPGWETRHSQSMNATYYYHTERMESSWERPVAPPNPPAREFIPLADRIATSKRPTSPPNLLARLSEHTTPRDRSPLPRSGARRPSPPPAGSSRIGYDREFELERERERRAFLEREREAEVELEREKERIRLKEEQRALEKERFLEAERAYAREKEERIATREAERQRGRMLELEREQNKARERAARGLPRSSRDSRARMGALMDLPGATRLPKDPPPHAGNLYRPEPSVPLGRSRSPPPAADLRRGRSPSPPYASYQRPRSPSPPAPSRGWRPSLPQASLSNSRGRQESHSHRGLPAIDPLGGQNDIAAGAYAQRRERLRRPSLDAPREPVSLPRSRPVSPPRRLSPPPPLRRLSPPPPLRRLSPPPPLRRLSPPPPLRRLSPPPPPRRRSPSPPRGAPPFLERPSSFARRENAPPRARSPPPLVGRTADRDTRDPLGGGISAANSRAAGQMRVWGASSSAATPSGSLTTTFVADAKDIPLPIGPRSTRREERVTPRDDLSPRRTADERPASRDTEAVDRTTNDNNTPAAAALKVHPSRMVHLGPNDVPKGPIAVARQPPPHLAAARARSPPLHRRRSPPPPTAPTGPASSRTRRASLAESGSANQADPNPLKRKPAESDAALVESSPVTQRARHSETTTGAEFSASTSRDERRHHLGSTPPQSASSSTSAKPIAREPKQDQQQASSANTNRPSLLTRLAPSSNAKPDDYQQQHSEQQPSSTSSTANPVEPENQQLPQPQPQLSSAAAARRRARQGRGSSPSSTASSSTRVAASTGQHHHATPSSSSPVKAAPGANYDGNNNRNGGGRPDGDANMQDVIALGGGTIDASPPSLSSKRAEAPPPSSSTVNASSSSQQQHQQEEKRGFRRDGPLPDPPRFSGPPAHGGGRRIGGGPRRKR